MSNHYCICAAEEKMQIRFDLDILINNEHKQYNEYNNAHYRLIDTGGMKIPEIHTLTSPITLNQETVNQF